jgi:hypothetical protein
LEDILLNVLFFATIAEHFRDGNDTSHSGSEGRTDLRRVNILVKFVRIGDSGHHESFSDGNECPERGAIDLSGDIVGNTESLVRPSGRDLTSDNTIESDSLGNLNLRSLLELDEVLGSIVGVDVDHLAVFALEAVGIFLGSLDRLEVVLKFDLLNESLLLGVVTTEEFRFCNKSRRSVSARTLQEGKT